MRNIIVVPILLISVLILSACSNKNTIKPTAIRNSPTIAVISPSSVPTTISDSDKMCGSIDKSDITFQVKFDDSVAKKDTSYEVGFAFSSINSTRRLARNICDYRVGFSYDELKKAGVTQLIVVGYSDSKRRQIKGDPITVIFNENGVPNTGSTIVAEILD